MASRPFASVAVTLDVGGTQIELLQGGIEWKQRDLLRPNSCCSLLSLRAFIMCLVINSDTSWSLLRQIQMLAPLCWDLAAAEGQTGLVCVGLDWTEEKIVVHRGQQKCIMKPMDRPSQLPWNPVQGVKQQCSQCYCASREGHLVFLHPASQELGAEQAAFVSCHPALSARLPVCTALTLGLLCCVLSAGIAIASALIDTSQQKPMDFKEKSQGLKNRKALPPAHQGTCV
ncbi:Attractin [Labeo rohita]|uniref:Attractin n=1 Tax=Labeo rohita TaxID=84645 RepID=A0ABQ8M659_LABRO|nr:Attractin [Labeo rohita]